MSNENIINFKYPSMKDKGINPLLTVKMKDDNIFNKIINGRECDETIEEGEIGSCTFERDEDGNKICLLKDENGKCKSYKKVSKYEQLTLEQRINEKYYPHSNTTESFSNKQLTSHFDPDNKPTIKEMLENYNYSKTICNIILEGDNNYNEFIKTPLPYNYENSKDASTPIEYELGIKNVKMTSYSNKDDYITQSTNLVNNNNSSSFRQQCNNFYKTYCELLNSELKQKANDNNEDYDISKLGKYEPSCLCYQDMFKDIMKESDYKQFRTPTDITGQYTKTVYENLQNAGVMINSLCYGSNTQFNNDKQFGYKYAPENYKNNNTQNIVLCNNTINMNNLDLKNGSSNAAVNINQSESCGAVSTNKTSNDETNNKTNNQTSSSTSSPSTNTSTNTPSTTKPSTTNQIPSTTSKTQEYDVYTPTQIIENKISKLINYDEDDNKTSNTSSSNTNSSQSKNEEKDNKEKKDENEEEENDNSFYWLLGGAGSSICCCCSFIVLIIFIVLMNKKK